MGRPHLPLGEGLFLPDTSSIHMLFMRFPIDCLFVGAADGDGRMAVLDLRHSLPAWRGVVWWVRGARGVFELPAGTLAGASVAKGDRVRLATAE